jgi:hypothetical protein
VPGVFFPCVYARAASLAALRSFFLPVLWSAAAWRRTSLFFGLACRNAQASRRSSCSCASCFSASSRVPRCRSLACTAACASVAAAGGASASTAACGASIYSSLSRECIVARTRAATVHTAAWRRFLSISSPCLEVLVGLYRQGTE